MLGKLLHDTDERLENTIQTLASIPEFFMLINTLVTRNSTALDGDHLAFIFSHTNLLNLGNKLIVGKKILVALDRHALYASNGLQGETDYGNGCDSNDEGAEQRGERGGVGGGGKLYSILRSAYATEWIYLMRENPWKSFLFYASGYSSGSNNCSGSENSIGSGKGNVLSIFVCPSKFVRLSVVFLTSSSISHSLFFSFFFLLCLILPLHYLTSSCT